MSSLVLDWRVERRNLPTVHHTPKPKDLRSVRWNAQAEGSERKVAASRMLNQDAGSVKPKVPITNTGRPSRLSKLPGAYQNDRYSVPLDGSHTSADVHTSRSLKKDHASGDDSGGFKYRERVRQYAQKVTHAIPLVSYLDNEWIYPVQPHLQAMASKILLA